MPSIPVNASAQAYLAKFLQRPENWFAAALILFFFFPWVTIGFISISGAQIPEVGRALQQATFAFNPSAGVSAEAIFLNAVYLIPILAAATIVMAVTGRDIKIVALATGGVVLLIFVMMLVRIGGSLFQALGVGSYLTLLAAIGIILAALGVIKRPMRP
jgi:hypothetical protein